MVTTGLGAVLLSRLSLASRASSAATFAFASRINAEASRSSAVTSVMVMSARTGISPFSLARRSAMHSFASSACARRAIASMSFGSLLGWLISASQAAIACSWRAWSSK
jgi:hypothetical protein